MSAAPVYLESIKSMAQKLQFLSYDSIQMDGMEIKSLWYQYKDLDFYYFETQDQRLVKLHVAAFGEVVEWNPFDGIRTGLIVQKEQAQGLFEVMHFDARPNRASIERVQSIIDNAGCLELSQKQKLQELFKGHKAAPRSVIRYLWQTVSQFFKF